MVDIQRVQNHKLLSDQQLAPQKPVTQLNLSQQYIGGLAALRVLALLAVCAYHLRPDVFVGGYLAVDLFFIISAYLTTNKLLSNWQQIDLANLYKRRFLKLWSPLFALCTFVLLLAFLFIPKLMQNMLPNYLSSLAFGNNFWQIYLGDSYFAEAVSPSAFKHLWYIAILGQFTLIWPALFKFLAKQNKLRSKLRQELSLLLLILIIVSSLSMALLYKANTDPTNVYYGTLTRAYAYCLGALLAVIVPSARAKSLDKSMHNSNQELDSKRIYFYDLVALPLLCLIIAIWMLLPANSNFTYRGGLLLHAVLCTLLVHCVVVPKTFCNQLFDLKVFSVIAKRAYAYYLWQYAVMIMLREKSTSLGLNRTTSLLLNIVLTLILAELAYRFVKQLNFKHLLQEVKLGQISLASLANLFVVLVFTLSIVPALVNSKPVSKQANAKYKAQIQQAALQAETEQAANDKQANAETKESVNASEKVSSTQPEQTELALEQVKGPYDLQTMLEMTKDDLSKAELDKLGKIKVTAVGDSVLLGCSRALSYLLPNFHYRAKESAQIDKAINDLEQLKNQQRLGDVILLAVGQNGYFNKQQAESLLKIAGDRPVFAYTIFVGKEWETANNAIWYDLAKDFTNLEIVDWHTYAKNNQALLWDGIHPNEKGQKAYARLFARTLLKRLAKAEA